MSRHMAVWGSVTGTLLMLFSSAPAQAQWLPFYDPCACVIPIAQPCYRTVPVTEYRQVKQIVQRPVYETKYVNQTVTAYRPVTETRTATIPTVSYQNVTEYRTTYYNAGYWRTRYECRRLPSPCEYDPRPDLFGWLNRTAYSIRASFTPRVIARREYVPRVVARNIPITRTVAHHGTRQITYKVTRMVAYTTTRKVAVNTVRYVAQEVVRTQPVTVWRTIPIGTTIAYSVAPYAATRTALQPAPDPIGSSRRTATSKNDKTGDDSNSNDNSNESYDRESSRLDSGKLDGLGTRRSQLPTPLRILNGYSAKLAGYKLSLPRPRLPSIVRTSRWVSRHSRLQKSGGGGPSLITPSVSVARNGER